MKKLTAGLIASLMLATSLPAAADAFGDRRDRHYRPDRHEQRYDRHDRYDRHERHRPQHHGNAAAWGVLGAGLALGAIMMAAEPPRPPVVMAPIVAPPPERMWYYCESAGAYYPYVGVCPEGWRAVPAY